MHKVSIIIPCFNEEENIAACLDSVCCLDYPKEKYEVILIDNGSTDSTLEQAEKYTVRILQNKTKNVSGLRNLGAACASGNILAFVDADCIVARNWLNKAERYFDSRDIVLWGSPPVIPENATWVQKAWYLVRKKEHPVESVQWLESMNLFVRKDQFEKVKGFDESLITCEDVDFSYRMFKLGTIMADSSIRVTHLGEASSVRIFLKKEIWRGKGNFTGVFKHGIALKELPSLAIPFYFALFLPVVIISALCTASVFLLISTMFALIFPGAFILFKVRRKQASCALRARLFILGYVYFIARTLAILPFKK